MVVNGDHCDTTPEGVGAADRSGLSTTPGHHMKQQRRRPAEVARAMPRPGSGIEVLPKAGTGHQSDHVVTKPLRQLFLAMRPESFRHQPRGVEPCRTSPVTPRVVTPIGEIKARHAADSRLAGAERWSSECRAKGVAHISGQPGQHQRDQPGDRTLLEQPAGPLVSGEKDLATRAPQLINKRRGDPLRFALMSFSDCDPSPALSQPEPAQTRPTRR